MDVSQAIMARRSVRAFLPTPVSPTMVRSILECASRAPSGANMQPWRVFVLTRRSIDKVNHAVRHCGVPPERAKWEDFQYYPSRFVEPFLSRRRQLGEELYGLLGIGRRDIVARRQHFLRNYDFFGAPVGMLFTVSSEMEAGSYLDVGMLMQNVMLLAQERGLDTCPQAAFAAFSGIVKSTVGIPQDQRLLCGMAMGYADRAAPSEALHTERQPVCAWAKFVDEPFDHT